MNRVLTLVGVACLCASAQAQSGRLFVGEYGYDPDNPPQCYETDLSPGFPGTVAWSTPFAMPVQGAACTPQNLIYIATGTFTSDLYVTIPGRAPTLATPLSQAIFDMGYVNGHLYGWAEYATPSGVYEINPTTGVCTLAVESTSELFFALDGNPADGMLYGYSEYGVTGLYRINPATGEKHRIAAGPPIGTFPNAYGMYRGLAVGNNKVYLTNVWNGRELDDPDHVPSDSYYMYDLAQGDNGVYVAFANPYANSTPVGGGSFWYDPSVVPVVPVPANDTCANATHVGEGVFAFDTAWASDDGNSGCGGTGDVWFLYTPTYTHYAVISTCGSSFDTVLDLQMPGCTDAFIDCNDDNPSCAPGSTIGTHVTVGQPLLVRISGWDGARGTGNLTIGACTGLTIDSQPHNATINACTATAPTNSPQSFVRFTVDASGRDDIVYQWRHNGEWLSDDGTGDPDMYGHYNTHGWSMLILRPTAADAGTYDCVLTSESCDEPQIVTTNPVRLIYCAADFNCSGGLEVQDIFDFLNAWFSAGPRSDFDGVNGLQVADIFAFLNAWFAGCQ